MVWEQGSVVIVMLTKLTENGVAMCHRYWPEEGSDLYHIYEVRLRHCFRCRHGRYDKESFLSAD